jgi:hypothetical protein
MIFRAVTVGFTAAADAIPFLIDRDTTLVGALFGQKGLVSRSPSDTFANVVSSNPVRFSYDILIVGNTVSFQATHLSFQLSRGDVIYCSASGAGSYQLLFIDPEPVP